MSPPPRISLPQDALSVVPSSLVAPLGHVVPGENGNLEGPDAIVKGSCSSCSHRLPQTVQKGVVGLAVLKQTRTVGMIH